MTKNSGKTWKLISDASGPRYCSDVIFVPKTQGQKLMAVGTQGIWWSGNQGQSWTKLSGKDFYTLEIISANEGLLAGKDQNLNYQSFESPRFLIQFNYIELKSKRDPR